MNAKGRSRAPRQPLSTTAFTVATSAEGTPLQVWTNALSDLVDDVRDELDGDAYRAFVWIATDRIGLEATRLVVGEALAATRQAA